MCGEDGQADGHGRVGPCTERRLTIYEPRRSSVEAQLGWQAQHSRREYASPWWCTQTKQIAKLGTNHMCVVAHACPPHVKKIIDRMHGLKPLLFLLYVGFFLYSKSRGVADELALLGVRAHTAGALLEENADLRQRIAQLEHRAQECEVWNRLRESCNHCGVCSGLLSMLCFLQVWLSRCWRQQTPLSATQSKQAHGVPRDDALRACRL